MIAMIIVFYYCVGVVVGDRFGYRYVTTVTFFRNKKPARKKRRHVVKKSTMYRIELTLDLLLLQVGMMMNVFFVVCGVWLYQVYSTIEI